MMTGITKISTIAALAFADAAYGVNSPLRDGRDIRPIIGVGQPNAGNGIGSFVQIKMSTNEKLLHKAVSPH